MSALRFSTWRVKNCLSGSSCVATLRHFVEDLGALAHIGRVCDLAKTVLARINSTRMCASEQSSEVGAHTVQPTLETSFSWAGEKLLATYTHSAGENRLLQTLLLPGRRRLLAVCEQIELHPEEVICKAGERMSHVYFPTEGIISLVTTLDDGSHLEVGGIGHEGMLGSSLILGINTSAQQAVVQRAGTAWRLGAPAFQWHLRENPELRRLLNCYVYVLMGQLAQTSACSHYHQVRARLARWLLTTRDRARGNQFHVTQEFLAHMLGVRRVGITNAANSLRAEGLIDYRRGAVTILDGAGLEQVSCACYRGGNDLYERALSLLRASPRARRSAPSRGGNAGVEGA